MYLSTEASTVLGGRIDHCRTSLKRKNSRGNRKKEKKWERENGKWLEIHRPYKTKRGECDYTDEALAILKHLKLLMDPWRALMSALDTEFKPSKKPLPKVLNLN